MRTLRSPLSFITLMHTFTWTARRRVHRSAWRSADGLANDVAELFAGGGVEDVVRVEGLIAGMLVLHRLRMA